ncbi:MAG: hypothetical protein CM15mP45_01820 [Deltaproteobacteria bacterium]|nr:MAG: hypothetical protein CM15mP45_01820 [Deltaproteobacteria bacterium]
MMGLVDVAKSKLEDVDQVRKDQTLFRTYRPRTLYCCPDCGLGLLNRDLAKAN